MGTRPERQERLVSLTLKALLGRESKRKSKLCASPIAFLLVILLSVTLIGS